MSHETSPTSPHEEGAPPAQPPPPRIRFGLAAIKGVGESAVHSILEARQSGGPFTSLTDFCERVDTRTVNRRVLEAFIRSGACDSLGGTRAALFAQIDRALARGQESAQDRARGQSSLFGLLDPPRISAAAEPAAASPEWPLSERLSAEKELLGFYVTGHPLDPFRSILDTYGLTDSARLSTLPNRALTRFGGIISVVQQGFSKKSGKPYALITLEDLTGSVQILCINEAHDRYRDLFQTGRAVFVVGEVSAAEDRPKVFPIDIMSLEDVPGRLTRQVHLRFKTAETTADQLRATREVLTAHAGSCPLFLCFQRPDGGTAFVEVNDRYRVTPSLAFQRAITDLLGPGVYYAKADPTLPERPRKRWESASEPGAA